MIATNYTNVRNNFKNYCDKTVNDFETIIITRERGENVVLMSESEYNNILENLFIRSNPNYYNELINSIEQLEKGFGKIHKLIEADNE
jgi:antitoxin YefM